MELNYYNFGWDREARPWSCLWLGFGLGSGLGWIGWAGLGWVGGWVGLGWGL